MALRRIWTIDNPAENKILRAKAKKVSHFDAHLQKLVDDMWETMRDAPGVGLAAPQIGQSIRVLVAEYEEERVAFINPEILKRSDEIVLGTEGCLSIPGVVGDDVPRASAITVKGRDPHGKEIRVKAEGWFARVLQHEIDHLDGVLFTDHIPPSNVREVHPDEQIEEGEVERIESPKSGKNGKAVADLPSPRGRGVGGEVKRPEHNERPAPAHAHAHAAKTATRTAAASENPAESAMPAARVGASGGGVRHGGLGVRHGGRRPLAMPPRNPAETATRFSARAGGLRGGMPLGAGVPHWGLGSPAGPTGGAQ
jgi:peptide deformylase